ncbi:MAG: 3-deoxy-7-phosphoheptulonate synthase [Planctomycetes bacterium]|nr:3-deoxy-7-phosphoheptulonate synthase [Planctomycetota bacterium]
MTQTDNLHVTDTSPLLPPADLRRELPMNDVAAATVLSTRVAIRGILRGQDPRLLVVVGPCSIHDVAAARDYATRLLPLRRALADRLEIVMRVYFEKPRTTTGWKGLINDPHLDGTHDMVTGLRLGRQLLLDLATMGMPAATELLDPITPQYLADTISWTAIGARTTESQTHREMASGLSMPVGFKNGTDGSLGTATNAMLAASHAHRFLGIDQAGRVSMVATTGNPDGHLVLRGGKHGPNYGAGDVARAASACAVLGLCQRVMVDCSHDNANKDHTRQSVVLGDIATQLAEGSPHLAGVMIESHLVAGRQNIPSEGGRLIYGQSITDACVDFPTTEGMLRTLALALGKGRLQPQ